LWVVSVTVDTATDSFPVVTLVATETVVAVVSLVTVNL
jgi:hypothetical protein